MRLRNSDDNYWTRPFLLRGITDPQECSLKRVRMWLGLYPCLVASCRLGCKLDASASSGGSLGSTGSAGFTELVCVKADLDVAMRNLPPRWRIVMCLHYHEGLLQREIGKLMHCNQSTISRILSSGCIQMASQLV